MKKKEFMNNLLDNIPIEYTNINTLGEIAWQLKRIADEMSGENSDE